MRFGRVTSSQEVFNTPVLRRLQAQIRLLARLNETLHECLPQVAEHCRIIAYREGTLTLSTENQAFAGQLRYLQNSHLSALKKQPLFAGVQRLRVVIADAPARPRTRMPPLPPLSASVGELLLQTASQTSDPQLSEAFRRLASHASDRQTRLDNQEE